MRSELELHWWKKYCWIHHDKIQTVL